jgi:transposase
VKFVLTKILFYVIISLKLQEMIMGKKKYVVKLTKKQQKKLRHLTRKGEAKARQLTRARVLLLADYNRKKGVKSDEQISDILDVSLATIHRIRRQFATEGLDAALEEKPRCGRPNVFSGKDAAHITALACSDPPEGHGKWSVRLLADKAVELGYVETISYRTVSNMLKKTTCLRT